MFKVILMHSEKHNKSMWWVERVNEVEGKPDYYGPFFHKISAQNFKDNVLSA